jgi:hypothetical protein
MRMANTNLDNSYHLIPPKDIPALSGVCCQSIAGAASCEWHKDLAMTLLVEEWSVRTGFMANTTCQGF